MPRSNPFTALAYGPVAGDPATRATTYGPLGRLGSNDIAVSPNMLKQYPLGSMVTATDARGVPLGTYRVGDTSYYGAGKPTSNTVEFRDADRSGSKVFLNLADAPPVQVSAPDSAAYLRSILDNYGIGTPTATPTGYPPGMQPPGNIASGGGINDLLQNILNFFSPLGGGAPAAPAAPAVASGGIDRFTPAFNRPASAFGGIAGSNFGIGGYQGGIGGPGSIGFGFGASGMPSGGFGSIGPSNAFGGGGYRVMQL